MLPEGLESAIGAGGVVAAISVTALGRLRGVVPIGLTAQRLVGWLLLLTAGVYLLQAVLIVTGRPPLFV